MSLCPTLEQLPGSLAAVNPRHNCHRATRNPRKSLIYKDSVLRIIMILLNNVTKC